ncbi:hypothetical protein LRB_71 [Ligilactobacillus ruminis]|uniref:Uncharacterized protein n=1 Tax=Ligilactobacillus ruminis TaxID=1623 RepID=A0A837IXU0_9LACO|nr:hypothetical protein LRB_71 [Ligilactobacillus ruminis]
MKFWLNWVSSTVFKKDSSMCKKELKYEFKHKSIAFVRNFIRFKKKTESFAFD